MAFDFLAQIDKLSIANLTVREQTRLMENPLDLRWRAIFPPVPTDSIKISEISIADFRPIGGRREWNADGREIVEKLGPRRDYEMVPINPTHKIDEKQLQLLREPAATLAPGVVNQLTQSGIVATVDRWSTRLSDAAERQVERDAFEIWANNQLTVMDPKEGSTVTVAMAFDALRYVTEGTAWASVANAYDRLLFHLGEAVRFIGSVGVVRMRRATANEVVKDAPTGPNALRTTIANLEDRLSEEGFGEVTIAIDERTYDAWTDGGSAHTATAYVPTGKVLFQPANGQVGQTHFAPVTRAYDYMNSESVKRVNLNDIVIIYGEKNQGKTLVIEAQANAIPMPIEQYVYVVNAIT